MTRLVYSTGDGGDSLRGKRCRKCQQDPCRCEPLLSLEVAAHAVKVSSERSGRRGKTVTVAAPFFLLRADAVKLLGTLKSACASGGALKVARDRAGEACFALEIQGEQVDRVIELLTKHGYAARRAG